MLWIAPPLSRESPQARLFRSSLELLDHWPGAAEIANGPAEFHPES